MKIAHSILKKCSFAAFLLVSFQTVLLAQDTTLFYDDFSESVAGGWYYPINWTFDQNIFSWYCDNLGMPSSTQYANASFWSTGLADSIKSPVVNCLNRSKVYVQYQSQAKTGPDFVYGTQYGRCSVVLSVSGDSGATWHKVYTDSTDEVFVNTRTFDVSAYAAGKQYVIFKFFAVPVTGTSPSQEYLWLFDDFKVFAPGTMSYLSSSCSHNDTSMIIPLDTAKEILSTSCKVRGSLSPLQIQSITFSTNGSTNPSSITKAKLFVSNSNSFYSYVSRQIGSAVANPNGSFTFNFSPSFSIPVDSVFFYLTYDIGENANSYDLIDAECTSLTINGGTVTPVLSAPAGSRYIAPSSSFDTCTAFVYTTSIVRQGSKNNPMLRVGVVTHGGRWFKLEKMNFSTFTTTNAADITRARLFYSGLSSGLDTTKEAAAPVSNPSGEFSFTPSLMFHSASTDPTTVYFFLTYDVSTTANDNDSLRATFDSLTFLGSTHLPPSNGGTSQRVVVTYVTGIKTIGPSGDFTSFGAAITDLNRRWPGQGGVTYDISGIDFPEYFFSLNSNLGYAADRPIVFRKKPGESRNPKLIASSGLSRLYFIFLNGACYVTFDGLDLEATGSNVTYGYYVRNGSSTQGAQHITIKNCSIMMRGGSVSAAGIFQTVTAVPTASSGSNSYNKYINVTVGNAKSGILIRGNSAYPDDSVEIGAEQGEISRMGTPSAPLGGSGFYCYGISATNCLNISIHNTEVQNIVVSSNATAIGIEAVSIFGRSKIYNNKIHDLIIADTLGSGNWVYGMNLGTYSLNSTPPYEIMAYNNIIYGLKHRRSTPLNDWQAVGILTQCTDESPLNNDRVLLYHNTVRLDSCNVSSMALRRFTGTTYAKNNIFVNNCDTSSVTWRYVMLEQTGTKLSSDYNALYYSNYPSARQNVLVYSPAVAGYNAVTLPSWQVSGQDAHSGAYDPGFISYDDLHINPNISHFDFRGTPLPEVATDFDGIPRNPANPTMGAYEYSGPLYCALNLKAYLQGYYNNGTGKMNATDTLTVRLRNRTSPFSVFETQKKIVGLDGILDLTLPTVSTDSSFYVSIEHRNSIETWSAAPVSFAARAVSYDFTTAANKAYGNNMSQNGSVFCMYSGDVNQDGIVDYSDLASTDNDSYNFASGYLPTDVTGDQFVDYSDLSIVDNNSYNFIGAVTPLTAKKNVPATPKTSPRIQPAKTAENTQSQ